MLNWGAVFASVNVIENGDGLILSFKDTDLEVPIIFSFDVDADDCWSFSANSSLIRSIKDFETKLGETPKPDWLFPVLTGSDSSIGPPPTWSSSTSEKEFIIKITHVTLIYDYFTFQTIYNILFTNTYVYAFLIAIANIRLLCVLIF